MMMSAVVMLLYRETKGAVLQDVLDVEIKVDLRENKEEESVSSKK